MNFSQSFFDQKKNSGPKKNFSSYFQTSKTGNESDWIPQTPPSNFTMKGFERKPQQRQQQNQESSLINYQGKGLIPNEFSHIEKEKRNQIMIPFDDEIEKEKYNRVDTPQSSPKIQPNKGKKSNNNALMKKAVSERKIIYENQEIELSNLRGLQAESKEIYSTLQEKIKSAQERISQTSAILNQTDLCFQSCEKICQLYEVYQNKKEIHNASLETIKTSLEKKISQAKEENIIEKQRYQQLLIEDGIGVERKKFMFDLFQRKSLEFEALVKEENEIRDILANQRKELEEFCKKRNEIQTTYESNIEKRNKMEKDLGASIFKAQAEISSKEKEIQEIVHKKKDLERQRNEFIEHFQHISNEKEMKINKISELKTELQKMISNTEKSLQLQNKLNSHFKNLTLELEAKKIVANYWKNHVLKLEKFQNILHANITQKRIDLQEMKKQNEDIQFELQKKQSEFNDLNNQYQILCENKDEMKQKIEKEESQLKSCQFECDLLISKEEDLKKDIASMELDIHFMQNLMTEQNNQLQTMEEKFSALLVQKEELQSQEKLLLIEKDKISNEVLELEKLFQEKSNIFEARSDQQKLLDQIGIEWNQKISQLEIELTRKQSQLQEIENENAQKKEKIQQNFDEFEKISTSLTSQIQGIKQKFEQEAEDFKNKKEVEIGEVRNQIELQKKHNEKLSQKLQSLQMQLEEFQGQSKEKPPLPFLSPSQFQSSMTETMANSKNLMTTKESPFETQEKPSKSKNQQKDQLDQPGFHVEKYTETQRITRRSVQNSYNPSSQTWSQSISQSSSHKKSQESQKSKTITNTQKRHPSKSRLNTQRPKEIQECLTKKSKSPIKKNEKKRKGKNRDDFELDVKEEGDEDASSQIMKRVLRAKKKALLKSSPEDSTFESMFAYRP